MKKEEILEKSRKENAKKDVYEIEIESKACKLASVSMLILASIYYCAEIIRGNGQNVSLYSIISIYCAILYGYKGIKIEKRRALYIITSVIWSILTVLLILDYFKVI